MIGAAYTPTDPRSVITDLGRHGLTDADVQYIARAVPAFEDLRQVVAELAGLILLRNIGDAVFTAMSVTAHARELFRDASEQIDTLQPGPHCLHHKVHLRKATEILRPMFDEGRWSSLAGRGAQDATFLKAAWAEVVHAANALPGFETHDLSQACCASHMKLRQASTISCEGAPS